MICAAGPAERSVGRRSSAGPAERSSMSQIETLSRELSARIRARVIMRGDRLVVSFPEGDILLSKDDGDERWVVWAQLDTFELEDRLAAAKASLANEVRETLEGAAIGVPSGATEAIIGRNFAPKTKDAMAFVEAIEGLRAALPAARAKFREIRTTLAKRSTPRIAIGDNLDLIRI
jgi:hypothetical protein